ncbi:MAG: putative metalloprotease CJM1_0395 family protein [Halochromatium sp.]|uniref:putative metalloprotease CJM1_0395 family protein n=1 Tax=Halochromatium sp. TaxID=2049430 RepID=UPI00397B5CC5
MIIPTATGPIPFIATSGNPAQGGVLAPGQPRATSLDPARQPGASEPGHHGAQIDRAAEEGASGRVAEGDAARNARNDRLEQELSPQELRLLEQLKQTDRKVRQHEMAHQIAGGRYTGSARYDYEIGPDGQRYAVAGRVSVDYGPITGDPRATIEKMQTVIAAALAPADPSPADYQIAARARQNLLAARLEMSQQQQQLHGESLPAERRAADAEPLSPSAPGRDPRVEDYSRIAASTGAGSGQAFLRSIA